MSKIIKLLNEYISADLIKNYIISHILPNKERAILQKEQVIKSIRYSGWKYSNMGDYLFNYVDKLNQPNTIRYNIRNLLRIIKNDDDFLNEKYEVDFNNLIINCVCEPIPSMYDSVIIKKLYIEYFLYFDLVDMKYHTLFETLTTVDTKNNIIDIAQGAALTISYCLGKLVIELNTELQFKLQHTLSYYFNNYRIFVQSQF